MEKIVNEFRRSLGAEAVIEPIRIEELKQGFRTYRLEIQPETVKGQPSLRIMVTTFAGSGKNGCHRKSFTWPVENQNPKQFLQHLVDTVLAALEPGAEINDPRTWLGRTFDNLTGVTYHNSIPCIAEYTLEGRRIWLTAQIMEDKQQGPLVTLYHEREKKSPMWMRLPVATFRQLQEQLHSS